MTRAAITAGLLATSLVVLFLGVGRRAPDAAAEPDPTATSLQTDGAHVGLIYGRVRLDDGGVYEGRLRFGGDEEALWGNYFNGVKDANPWAVHVPRELLVERRPIEIFGIRLATLEHEPDLGRPFMARFGDIAGIEAWGRDLTVTLRNGTVVALDRYEADDFADGVRVWDDRHGVVDLDEWAIRRIDFLSAVAAGDDDVPLYGTVHTDLGDFTGFVQWDREACLGSDELVGLGDDGEVGVPFGAIGAIARRAGDGVLLTLRDGRELVLSGTRAVGEGNRGVYVDDPRYGRVLVSWEAFQRLDLGAGGPGPAYDDFAPGLPLVGTVTTRDGRRLAGRLVYDLDESESTETLDAPTRGVDYTIPFRLVASIVPAVADGGEGLARVTLRSGEELLLQAAGDLGPGNAGLLVFGDDSVHPEYVPWGDVERIDLDRRPAVDPS